MEQNNEKLPRGIRDAGNARFLRNQRVISTQETRFNARLLFSAAACGLAGCLLTVYLHFQLLSDALCLSVFAVFAVMTGGVFAGALWSESISPCNIGYGRRALIAALLCLGMLLEGGLAALFQAFYNGEVLSPAKTLVLVVDRSGSMGANPESDRIARQFIDEVSTRLEKGQRVDLYEFPEKPGPAYRSVSWLNDCDSITGLLSVPDGGSNFKTTIGSLTDRRDCVIVMVTDCQLSEDYVDPAVCGELKKNNAFFLIQVANDEFQPMKDILGDRYLVYQEGGSDEQVADFLRPLFELSRVWLLSPVPGGTVNLFHLLILCVLGAFMRFMLFVGFGCSRKMALQIPLGVLAGAACCLILYLPLTSPGSSDPWRTYFHVCLSLLPFCLIPTVYKTKKTQIVHDDYLG